MEFGARAGLSTKAGGVDFSQEGRSWFVREWQNMGSERDRIGILLA